MDHDRVVLIVEMAVGEPTAGGNPVEHAKNDALKLLNAALEGR
ncbi:alcohol dehydrogenase, partial [Brucella melitensis]